jgi:1-acyl-sn-glycerol-3-phosphate acyltransferase
MTDINELINQLIFKPTHEIVKGFRLILKKMGVLNDIEKFVYKNIEDPLFYSLLTKMYGLEIENEDAIPPREDGCCVFAANNQSILDWIVGASSIVHKSKRIAYILTKAELGDHPVLGNFIDSNQVIYIKRGENDVDALIKCSEVIINENRPVLVYPEGTYGPGDGKLLKFKSGVSRIAWVSQAPVVPMAILGTDQIIPKANFKEFKSKGKIRVRFGNPIPISDLFPNKKKGQVLERSDFLNATKIVQEAVQNLIDGIKKQS